jgi:hypothetical protein
MHSIPSRSENSHSFVGIAGMVSVVYKEDSVRETKGRAQPLEIHINKKRLPDKRQPLYSVGFLSI